MLTLISELGYLMMMKSKYGPGGEFDPEWFVTLSYTPRFFLKSATGNHR